MATLTGELISETYDSLLKVTDNNTITGIKKRITDGFGNDIPLLLSSTDLEIDGTFILSALTDLAPASKFLSLKADNSVGFRTSSELLSDIGGASSASISGTTGRLSKFTSSGAVGNSILNEIGNVIHLTDGTSSYASFGINNPGIDNDAYIGSTINNDFLIKVNNTEALRIDTAFRLKIANIQNALGDTDKFLVSEDGVVKYRTGDELRSDIGAGVGSVTSVGLTMPVAFSVANSPITSSGTLEVTAVGTASQYIRGDGQLATLPTGAGGGSAVNYYLNGSVNASVATYKQMSNTAIIGAGTDFNLTGNGLIAQFLTDVGNPNRLQIPGGAWNLEMFFNISSSGGNAKFYVDLFKYDGTTFTSIASGVTNPEEITGGTSIDLYLTSLAVPETALLITDRLAIRVYIVDNSGGRTVTLHTEDNTLCQVTTTFAGGISALNGLTANTQYFAVGTSGTDFAISSLSDTHTFNLPNASATARGVITTGTQTIAGVKSFTDNLLIGDLTNTGQRLKVVGTTLLNGLQTLQGTTASDSATLGAELLSTGTSDASWTGTDFATGYTHVAGSITTLTAAAAATLNLYYQITYVVTGRTAGSFTVAFGGYTSLALTASGNAGPRATTTGSLVITPTSDFNGTIVLSIKNITSSSATTSFLNSSGLVTNEIRVSNINSNTFVGRSAANRNTTGSNNAFFGSASGTNNTSGANNSFFGSGSALNNNTGSSNAFYGFNSGVGNTTGSNNVFIGSNTGQSNTISGSNTFIGTSAGSNNVTGNSNTFIGVSAGGNNITGSSNLAIGLGAARFIANGTTANTITTNSIYLGNLTRALADNQTNQVVIGYDVTGLGSNTTILGNASTVTTGIYGRLLLGSIVDNAVDRLQVTGSTNITGQLKLGSTITNGTFTYTLPSATGTLALTSALTAYVTLATTQTITGQKSFITSGLGESVNIQNNGAGYGLKVQSGSAFFQDDVIIQGFLKSPSFTYTLPNATGTLALTSALTAYVPYTGATGAVNLGEYDLTVNALTVGRGGGALFSNTAFGGNALFSNTTGQLNTSIGYNSGTLTNAGAANQTSQTSVYIGADTRASASGNINEIVIGCNGRGGGSNSATLGNTSIATTNLHGNTSIGYTTNPSLYKLDVNGTLRVAGAATFSSSVNVGGVSANTDFRIYRTVDPTAFFHISAPGGDPLTSILGIGNTNVMSLNATGNVGIGTTAPVEQLTISGAGSRGIGIQTITSGDPFVRLYDNTTIKGDIYWSRSSNYMGINSVGIKTVLNEGGGNVGIGTTTPSYQLQLSTDSAAKPTSALWTIASDERIKENITPYIKGLADLLKINPINYDYNGLGGFKKGKGGVGIIAQEIINVLPDSVNSVKGKLNETDKEEIDILNFNGHELTYVLINAIKEQQAQIEELKLLIQNK